MHYRVCSVTQIGTAALVSPAARDVLQLVTRMVGTSIFQEKEMSRSSKKDQGQVGAN